MNGTSGTWKTWFPQRLAKLNLSSMYEVCVVVGAAAGETTPSIPLNPRQRRHPQSRNTANRPRRPMSPRPRVITPKHRIGGSPIRPFEVRSDDSATLAHVLPDSIAGARLCRFPVQPFGAHNAASFGTENHRGSGWSQKEFGPRMGPPPTTCACPKFPSCDHLAEHPER